MSFAIILKLWYDCFGSTNLGEDMTLGQLIKSKRDTKGWTQHKLAAYMDCREGDISRWERDETHPNLQSWKRLSVLLDLTIDDLQETGD